MAQLQSKHWARMDCRSLRAISSSVHRKKDAGLEINHTVLPDALDTMHSAGERRPLPRMNA